MEETMLMVPQGLQETGIRRGLLEDLALKILYLNGEMSLVELSNHTCLSLAVIEEIFQFLRKEQLCEVKGMAGGSHRIVASTQGKQRAADLLSISQYAGPAPVSLLDYAVRVRAQSVQQTTIQPPDVMRAFHQLVLSQETITRVGTAVVSGTSMFLYGPTGTGKTSMASIIPSIYGDSVWIPHALEVDNQIITIYDPGVHRQSRETVAEEFDKRWVFCHRPRVLAGGELCAEMLDLQYNPASRFYTAPLQMKANNGVLILDDFGRQRMRPEELLNRWMTPLDRRVDFLTLPGGKKFEIPFDLFVVFSTNLDPRQLADEAFLRRIPNKIKVDYATREQFSEIFRRECEVRLLSCDAGLLEHLIQHITKELGEHLHPCYPRDLLDQVQWAASFQGEEPKLTWDKLERACQNYFLPSEEKS